MTRTGRCLCGEVTYELDGEPLRTVLCHCEHCQRQSGGAFSVNLIATEEQLTISGNLSTFEDTGESGDAVYVHRRFCGSCGSPILSAFVDPPGMVALKAGTLDDRSYPDPELEVWCVEKQPWLDVPGLRSLERE